MSAALASGLLLVLSGAVLARAWQAGMWASLVGVGLVVAWVIAVGCWSALTREPLAVAAPATTNDAEVIRLRVLLDQVPVPLLRITRGETRALNRAARALFATDDRILPVPSPLLTTGDTRLRHEGRTWRIDAVDAGRDERLIVLVDVEAEERAAEDRANDEMIDILGHELLNGLSPVVSLADSAIAAEAQGDAMLPDILATLARRIEGLEGFTRAYRRLARLPAPAHARTPLRPFIDDLARLFTARFATTVALDVAAAPDRDVDIDRDQLVQAVWALLQNGAEAALAATGPQWVSLHVLAEGSWLRFLVRDSGDGVAVADRARVFRPFHTSKSEGSGIGLSLARRIARGHGGDVHITSDHPTCFTLQVELRSSL